PDSGQIAADKNLSIGFLKQDIDFVLGRTVLEETYEAFKDIKALETKIEDINKQLVERRDYESDGYHQLMVDLNEIQHQYEILGGYNYQGETEKILQGLGFKRSDFEKLTDTFSGGWRMRIELAKLLLQNNDILLLDEPTNHLDIESIIWLEGFLKDFQGALVLTSHDRAFLNRVVSRIVDIDAGELVSYSGNYDFYEQQWKLRREQQAAQFARQQAMLAKEQAFIERFKARASHAAQVQSRVKKLEKIEKIDPPRERKVIEFEFRAPPRSGEDVATLEKVHKAYGDKVIYEGLDLLIRRQERWCV